MTIKYTKKHRSKLEAFLATHDLPRGLGDKKSACTLASINLALTGTLTDEVPDCMSEVLGGAAIVLQDDMPDKMRNSARYKSLILNMPGTGREREAERLSVLMDWMWTVVLPQVQPVADKHGFGAEWSCMCVEKTVDAAITARDAAITARDAADAAARADAAYDAYAAAAYAADAAARAAAYAADAARADAAYAADARAAAYAADARADFWDKIDPIGVLERMTYIDKGENK